MDEAQTFDLTLERIALIRRMVVAWDGAAPGAPTIHPEAPYGSTDRDEDIANVTGDDEGAGEEHRALGEALIVFLAAAHLRPGRYQYHNPLAKLDPGRALDVFRDAATGESPEHITFDLGAAHLRLLPRLALSWDAHREVPAVDPVDPYGPGAPFARTMAGLLAAAPAAGAGGADLDMLHREMQPALQVFLRHAEIAPGLFRRTAGSAGWAPA